MPIERPGPIPAELEQRGFSFVTEYYRLYAWSHGLTLAALDRVFPDPLRLSGRPLRRARLEQQTLSRGERASGPMGTGRFVGRHPTSGDPIVAWNPEAYDAMCAAFDEENARRIAARRALSDRYGWSTAACARRALRTDHIILLLVLLGAALPALSFLGEGEPFVVVLVALFGFGTALVLAGLLVALSFIISTPIAALIALFSGARALRASRHAAREDAAGRASAADIVTTIQSTGDKQAEKIDRYNRVKVKDK